MANYYASIRTNYFRVKDEKKFREFMAHVSGTEDRGKKRTRMATPSLALVRLAVLPVSLITTTILRMTARMRTARPISTRSSIRFRPLLLMMMQSSFWKAAMRNCVMWLEAHTSSRKIVVTVWISAILP